ncbi:MAG TPA: phage holin family protein [Opitutaceae bacterium]|nr:phage holin family protein [Opitutaceae bacterium]
MRVLADNLLGSVHDRLELISVELQEEKQRLIQIFIWISAAIFTGMMAIAFASFTIVFLFWESARVPALVGVTVVYAAAATGIALGFRRMIARQPGLFAGSLQELKNDRECIPTDN